MENEAPKKSEFWNGSPKVMFLMGLFLGLAVASVAALGTVVSLMWSGKIPTALAKNVNTQAAVDPSAANQPAQPPAVKPVQAVDAKTDHITGNPNGKVTLIEYSDFECPYCKRHEATVQQVLKDFPKDVRVVYRNFPLTSIHANAEKAAEASECAAKLGGNTAFWKMHAKIFDKSPDIGPDALVALAKDIGLNQSAFKSCLDSGEMKSKVDAQFTSGSDSGVEGTPATFINGKLLSGAVPYANIKSEIQAAGGKE